MFLTCVCKYNAAAPLRFTDPRSKKFFGKMRLEAGILKNFIIFAIFKTTTTIEI